MGLWDIGSGVRPHVHRPQLISCSDLESLARIWTKSHYHYVSRVTIGAIGNLDPGAVKAAAS